MFPSSVGFGLIGLCLSGGNSVKDPTYDRNETSVFNQIMAGTGCTTNPVEAFHHAVRESLPAKPKLYRWLNFFEEQNRKGDSIMAQVFIHPEAMSIR